MKLTCPSCETSYEIAETAMPVGGRKVRCARCGHRWHARAPGDDADVSEDFTADEADAAEDLGEPEASVPAPREPAAAVPERAEDAELVAAEMVEDEHEHRPEEPLPPVRRRYENADPRELAAARAARRARARAQSGGGSAMRTMYGFVIGATLAMSVLAVQYREDIVRSLPETARVYRALGMNVNIRGLQFDALAPQRTIEDGVPTLVVEGKILNIRDGETEVPALHFVLRSASGDELYNWTIEPLQRVLEKGGELPFKTRLASPPAEADAVELRFVDRSIKQAGIRP